MKYIPTSRLLFSVYLLLLFLATIAQGAEAPRFAEQENHTATVAERSEAADETQSSNSDMLAAKFVRIPAGTFTMGGPGKYETQQHDVKISKAFYQQETELTQGQWRKIMGSNPAYFKKCGEDCPVEQVSWNDVQDFIRILNQRDGGNKYRLPTEAEWEYAARSGGKQEEYAGTNSEPALEDYAWFFCLFPSCWKTHPIGQKKPNGLGLYDMSGKVFEWAQDWYGTYPAGSVTDPVGPPSGLQRIFRGGSWYYSELACRTADRSANSPAHRTSNLGFRLVMTPHEHMPVPQETW